MNGKGDKPRPVDKQKYDDNFADIFGEYVPLWKRKGQFFKLFVHKFCLFYSCGTWVVFYRESYFK